MSTATNQPPENAIAIYWRSWKIENLFSWLKGRGFQFEATRLTRLERVEKLMVLLAVGVAWAHKAGEWRNEKKPIRYHKYKYPNSLRPQFSLFRYGLDLLQAVILNSNRRITSLAQFLIPPIQNHFNNQALMLWSIFCPPQRRSISQ